MNQIPQKFNQACERWRGLYRAAKGQQFTQQKIINNMSRPAADREKARRLRQEAESQLELLTDAKNLVQSDFYSYRYFASEGFLPGYSFPRLPLSAFIPGRRIRGDKDEFLSRPRFLAISEFGPQSIIYHEGSRYTISKVNLPISDTGDGLATSQAKHCPACGYFHPDDVAPWAIKSAQALAMPCSLSALRSAMTSCMVDLLRINRCINHHFVRTSQTVISPGVG